MRTKDYTEKEMLEMIGHQVEKTSQKPFKSGSKINTVRGITQHPKLEIPCFTFEEDDSYVEARRCLKIKSL